MTVWTLFTSPDWVWASMMVKSHSIMSTVLSSNNALILIGILGCTVSHLMFWIVFFGCRNNPSRSANRQRTYKTVCRPQLTALLVLKMLFPVNRSQMTKYAGNVFLILMVPTRWRTSDTMCVKADLYEDCLRHAARDVERNIFSTLTHATPQPMKLMPEYMGRSNNTFQLQISESMSRI